MKHEIDMKRYPVRTDLIIENESFDGIHKVIEEENGIKITDVHLENKNALNKEKGDYITIEFNDVTDHDNYNKVLEIFTKNLKKLLAETNIKESDTCFIIGLGNRKSTADSLGPLVIDNILVTNYLYLFGDLDDGYRRTYAIAPGVTGQTGIETTDYILSIVEKMKPDFLIIIDALASKSIERVNKTIQMSNTGIAPGSGIGNNRKKLNSETINIPIISIGIPTVVDAATVVSDTIFFLQKQYAFQKKYMKNPRSKLVSTKQINYLKEDIKTTKEDNEYLLGLIGTLSNDEIKSLMDEVLTPIGYNMIVTTKEIDFVIEKLSKLVSEGINSSLHKKID